MSKRNLSPQRAREQALFLYCTALERGDFKTVAAISKLAETDPVLDRMIAEVSELLEEPSSPQPRVEIRQVNSKRGVEQVIRLQKPSLDGQSLNLDHQQEDDEIMFTTFDGTIRTNRYHLQFLTGIAAALILIVLGTILLNMASRFAPNREDSYSLAGPTLAGCQAAEDADAQSESLRLAGEAQTLLAAETPDTELARLLGICALQTTYTTEADTTLQRALLSMEAVLTVPGNSGIFNSAVFSPDGKYFLVTLADGAHLRNVETGEEIKVFPTDRPLYEFATGVFSSNGQYILSNTGPDTARLWDVETGTAIREFTALGDWAIPALSPDGEYAAFTVNGDIQLWKIDTGTLERTLSTDLSGWEWITFSPDGASLLIGGNPMHPSAVHQWDVKTGTKIREFLGLKSETNVAIFSPDGRYVISGGDPGDARAILWDAKTGAQIRTFTDFPAISGFNNVQTFAFSPDSRFVLIGSANRTARMFDIETGFEVRRFENNPGYVTSVGFSPDGKTILIGSYGVNGRVHLWPTSIADLIATACAKATRDFTAEERAHYGISGDTPTCPQFGENYELSPGMTPIPSQPVPVWTPLPPLEKIVP